MASAIQANLGRITHTSFGKEKALDVIFKGLKGTKSYPSKSFLYHFKNVETFMQPMELVYGEIYKSKLSSEHKILNKNDLTYSSEIIDEFCQLPIQFALLGTGEPRYHTLFKKIQKKYKNVFVNLTFDDSLAYQIYAGSDMFLMPSHYEPCGLGQLISFAFGTVPIVRKTGGLADTVIDYNEMLNESTGFVFTGYEPLDLLDAIKRAIEVYNDAVKWGELIKRGMNCDFSWGQSAKEYLEMYETIVEAR